MTEISKGLKIVWIINAAVAGIYGIIYLIFYEEFSSFGEWPYNDPVAGRLLGVTLLVLGSFCVVGVIRKDWEKVQIFMEFGIAWIVCSIFVVIWGLIALSLPDASILWQSFDVLVLLGILIANLYFYFQHRKLS